MEGRCWPQPCTPKGRRRLRSDRPGGYGFGRATVLKKVPPGPFVLVPHDYGYSGSAKTTIGAGRVGDRVRLEDMDMDIQAVAGRMTELERAFQTMADSVPGLVVDVIGTMSNDSSLVHPVAGFHVKLQHGPGAGVALYISANYAELRRWPADGGAMRERFNVNFSEGFVWGDSMFEDPTELAQELLGYMQFNLDAATVG
jgi:hypothetical protein